MTPTAAARARTEWPRTTVVGLVVATTAVVGVLVLRPEAPRSSSFAQPPSTAAHRAVAQPRSDTSPPSFAQAPRRDRAAARTEDGGPVTEADGALPYDATAFDSDYPGIGNLDPDLLGALREASSDAAHDGIELRVTSGWRSAKYQNELLRQAVTEYGSAKEAARWVATADTSRHVSGDAVDIGPADATAWLSEHGAAFGLCQIYRNEPWHYELRPGAVGPGCPSMYADPTRDPTMQQ